MMGRRKGEGAPGRTAETPRPGQGLCWSAGFAPGTGTWCRSQMLETHCRYSNERMVHSRSTETRAGCLVGDSPWLAGILGFESRRKKGLSWTHSHCQIDGGYSPGSKTLRQSHQAGDGKAPPQHSCFRGRQRGISEAAGRREQEETRGRAGPATLLTALHVCHFHNLKM